ncbi:MAG TPA: hypothetical protein VHZ74_01125 [Bryobacteraceae bacterium]|jgi:hypothetical protein|nr:hypothetical protein [Bryobacteraceae bacterium]
MKTTLLAALAMLSISFVASAADATGKWAGETPGRNGNQPITFNLKAAGDTLTGTITTAQGDRTIEEGKVDGDNISFVLSIPGRDGGPPNKQTYKGKVSADSIEFTREGGRGPITFTAKKQ